MTGELSSRDIVDLRSDTVTLPTADMRTAMAAAEVGDDFYGDDPTVRELEAAAAKAVGKEAALYVSSGTMGNLLAHLTHCPGGAEVIGPQPAHTFLNERGAVTRVAGMTPRFVAQHAGELDLDGIAALIAPAGLLTQPTGLIWVEQPTRGYVVSLDQLVGLRQLADAHKLPVHMDGARIFHAAIALGRPAAQIAGHADTVMFCVSKGLGAPVGSLLAGPADFVVRARQNRQMIGGGLRQAGIIAAGGLYALRHNIERLAEDHENARRLAHGLAALPGLRLDRDVVEMNMFYVEVDRPGLTVQDFASALCDQGVLVNVPAPGRRTVRFVTHLGIERGDVDRALRVAAEVISTLVVAPVA